MTTTAVYRLYGLDETLLYVGMTNHLGRRLAQHSLDKPWFVEVGRIEVEQFGERHLAEDAESVAIWQEHPRYNKRNPIVDSRIDLGRSQRANETISLAESFVRIGVAR